MPLHTVRDWLGHTSISQTSTYLACTLQGHHDAMTLFDQRRGALQDGGKAATNDGDQTVPPTTPTDAEAPQSTERTH